jgi:DNA-binding transcriptional ArsR family regulator
MGASGEGRKRKPQGKKGKPGKKARKAGVPKRPRKRSSGQRRAHLLSAIAHPLRRRILRALHDWDEPASPVQLARAFRLPLATIAYHANVLKRFGAVEPAGEKQVRGAIEHFYDSTIEDDPPIETLLEETREVDEEDA